MTVRRRTLPPELGDMILREAKHWDTDLFRDGHAAWLWRQGRQGQPLFV